MLANREKGILIIDICGKQNESGIQNILKLLDILIQEVRLDNDTADDVQFRTNQGQIKAYLTLKEYILRGLPAINRLG